jgi:hypothetical protein
MKQVTLNCGEGQDCAVVYIIMVIKAILGMPFISYSEVINFDLCSGFTIIYEMVCLYNCSINKYATHTFFLPGNGPCAFNFT